MIQINEIQKRKSEIQTKKATIAALSTVENNILDASNCVKKTDYDT